MLPLASYMVYDGDSIFGSPLGSLFFYAQLRLFPFVSFTQTVTLVNLDNSSPTVLLINLRENLGNISTYFFLWWGSDQGSWITQITSTRNGPAAMTTYRPNGDTEFVGDFSFTEISGAASFKIFDGPPLKQMNNSLYIYRPDMNMESYWPVRLDGVLNTYLAENSTVTVDFEYGKDTNDKSRFNFLVSNTRVNFDNSSKGGSLIVTINDVDIHNNIFMKQQISLNSSKSDIELLVNASGYSMEIGYIESPNHNSDFYFQFEFGKPTIFGPE
ncbi:hypothetical protein WR25_24261 [Diploscapter pachys]|uniref:Uncharacterized protein n=1 Tax=Diploscapter pachys TaxID=2018661 RepID=A0A2A2LK39_9BILA|nr:hypothetical protein WR25_24261 [Diploscapter pachys]